MMSLRSWDWLRRDTTCRVQGTSIVDSPAFLFTTCPLQNGYQNFYSDDDCNDNPYAKPNVRSGKVDGPPKAVTFRNHDPGIFLIEIEYVEFVIFGIINLRVEIVTKEICFHNDFITGFKYREIFWVLGVGYWVLGVGCWVLGVGFWVLGVGCWVLGIGCWVLDI